MNKDDQERIAQFLKKTLQPISSQVDTELRRDLWPLMLRRLEARSTTVPWLDWALLAAVAACLVLFPGGIPVLLYHL